MLAAVCFVLCVMFSFLDTSGSAKISALGRGLRGSKPQTQFIDPDETLRHYNKRVGQTAYFECRVESFQFNWKMMWYKNGKRIEQNKRKRIRFRSGKRPRLLLKLRFLREDDAGMYKCVVSNKYGNISREIKLTVGHPWFVKPFVSNFSRPQFIAWPASKDLELRCAADGEPPLKYTWLKDGKVLKYRRLDPKFNNFRWFLTIKTAVSSDNGIYKCIVSNRLGNISQMFKLKVIEKEHIRPVLSNQFPVNKTAKVGENVTFQCVEIYSPWITDYRWLHWKKLPPTYPDMKLKNVDASRLNSSYYTVIHPKHYRSFNYKKGEYGGRVLLTNVTKENEGVYTCLISNHIGKNWRSAFLKIVTSGLENVQLYLTLPQSLIRAPYAVAP